MAAWRALSIEEQERAIGRSEPSNAHVTLNDLDEGVYHENTVFGSFWGASASLTLVCRRLRPTTRSAPLM